MRESAKDLDARSVPRVLTDLFVECASGLTEDEVRSAVNTWLSVKDDEEALGAEVELDMEEITENISNVHVEDGVSVEEKSDEDYRVSSDTTNASKLGGSPFHRDLERALEINPNVHGLKRLPTLPTATEHISKTPSLAGVRTPPTDDTRRLASGADSDENGGVELVQDAHRTSDDLVYAPDTECDEFWLSWPGVQERAIADGTVLVFDVFSSVGNLFIALEHAMKVARMLELGLILTWSNFPGFRQAFDPAEINWAVDPAPFTTIDIAAVGLSVWPASAVRECTNATGLHSLVFQNYAMVLSNSQVDRLALELGIAEPTGEALVMRFKEMFPERFQGFITNFMREPIRHDELLRTTPCVWNMLLHRSRSMMDSMEEHSPWKAVGGESARLTNRTEYIAWHIRTSEGETAKSYLPDVHRYVIQEPATVVCPTYMVATEDVIQAVYKCPSSHGMDIEALPVYISSNSKRMAKECTLEAADHHIVMGHVDLGLDESDAHTGYSKNPERTAVSAFLDFLFLLDSKIIVRTGSSFSGTVAGIKGLRCHSTTYDLLPKRPVAICIPSDC
eukprot:jgi/Undpi1/11703/HiC_scaffold_36.g13998.m1